MADRGFYRSFGDSQGDPHEPDPEESEENTRLPEGWQRGLLYSIVGGAGLYLGLTLWSGAEQIWQGLRAVSPLTLAGLLLLVLAGYLVRFGRWHWYLRHLGETVAWRDNLKAFLASFALTATPGKAGESVKAYFLKRSSNVDPARSLAGLFAERFTDVFSVVLVICVGLFSLPQGRWIVLGIGGVQIAGIALLQRPRWVRRAVLLPVAGRSTARRWVRPVDTMLSDTSALLRPRVLLGGILLGGLPWIGEGVAMYVLFDALGAEAIALHEAILIHAAATLFGAVTFLPGGLGGHEAASVSLSLLYGATQAQAVVATVLIRLLTLWFAVALGLLVFSQVGLTGRMNYRQ
nr:lysylphosphatidylglycerol synthase transmembrane domain-containing protein [Salinibacter ruber]